MFTLRMKLSAKCKLKKFTHVLNIEKEVVKNVTFSGDTKSGQEALLPEPGKLSGFQLTVVFLTRQPHHPSSSVDCSEQLI